MGVEAVDLIPNPGTADEGIYLSYFKLKNNTSGDLNVHAIRVANDTASGHESYFCWDICWGVGTNESQDPVAIAAGDTTGFGQYLALKPNNTGGYSEVTMRFVNAADGADFVEITYKYSVDGVLSISDPFYSARALSNPYPNPASTDVRVDYELPRGVINGRLEMYSLIGKKVKETALNQNVGTAHLTLENVRSGIYFMYLKAANEEITSRKLVVVK